MKNVLGEAVLVAVLGATLSFAANSLSRRGLKLTTDYFPGGNHPSIPTRVAGAATNTAATPAQMALERLRQKGLQVVDDEQIQTLFHDPRYEQGGIIFIDARNDEEYERGHIPGAYHLDHMYAAKYLGAVLPACGLAQQIVVYCHGGDCELSEFAAELLRNSAGVPNEKLFIYAGGINSWQAHKLPLESGGRKSGQLTTSAK